MNRVVFLAVFLSSPMAAQVIEGLSGSDDTTMNQQALRLKHFSTAKSKERGVVVFIGDRVIPQFVDGSGWKTSITLVNLENHPVSFQVLFFRDDGSDLIVPVIGQGSVRGMNISLTTAGSLSFETAGTAAALAQGWAYLSQSTNDAVGGLAIFRQRVAGRPDFEAVVPIVNQFDNHFVLLFDNAGFTTATAIANPSPTAVAIPVNIRNELGTIIDTRTIALGPFEHVAFTLPDTWSSTAGRRGAVEFLTTGFGVGALGLRFSGAAFTSFHVLSNFNWR